MKQRRAGRKRIVRESFDRENRVARAVRSLSPADRDMDPESLERMMGHLLLLQRRHAARSARRRPFYKVALVPAVALIVVVTVLVAVLVPALIRSEKPEPASLSARLETPSGNVDVMAPGKKWHPAAAGESASKGWSIRTGEGSSVSVSFPDGSLMRMTDDSRAVLGSIEKAAVEVGHVSGETYHRTNTGSSYKVNTGDVTSEAAGAAFNVGNRVPGEVEIISVQHNVAVAIGQHEPIEVAEGEVMTISTAEATTAVKEPVSRERLSEERLLSSVEMDAEAGYSTGIYEKLDVPLEPDQAQEEQPAEQGSIELNGQASDSGVTLEWSVTPGTEFEALSLLRSEQSQPVYPDGEIALYTDISIASATDGGVAKGRTYQYRVAALSDGELVAYSNTVVINVPEAVLEPAPASISLSASSGDKGVTLEWSVSGATRFTGFLIERTVRSAPGGSETPAGTTSTRRIDTTNVFFTFQDSATTPGHKYSYRVGLVVDGAVMVYSDPVSVEVARQ